MSTLRVNNIQFNPDGNTIIAAVNTNNIVITVDGTEKLKVAKEGVNFRGPISVNNNPIFDGAGGLVSAGVVTINVNSSNAALRITQTGAGNALIVEDSTNPDSTPFVVDTNGKIISGSTTVIGGFDNNQINFSSHDTAITAGFGAFRWAANPGGPLIVLNKSRGSSIGTRTKVNSGDTLGTLSWSGDDGASFIQAAQISAAVDGTPETNDMPGRLVFSTTADGASSPTERMRITSNGRVGINTSSPTSNLDVNGAMAQNIVTVAASAIDCSLGNFFIKTVSGALTWTFTNVPASRSFTVLLELTNGGTGTQTWPAAVKWPGGTAPTLTASGVDLLGFVTDDGGTTWRGVALMTDSK